MKNFADIRKDYTLKSLDITDVSTNPFVQFNLWFDEAINSGVAEATAMHLATVSALGRPSGRIVLLKGVDQGFVFFTNYTSQKGMELAQNPYASLTFFWPELERQIRIAGSVVKVSEAESEAYFLSRPRGSQLSAVASRQSQVVPNRQTLEQRFKEKELAFADQPIQRPAHWGGYRLLPEQIEFWQGRPSRLHDRILYILQAEQDWKIERLEP